MVSFLQADSSRVLEAVGRSMGMIEFDPQGRILDANETFLQILGYERSEVAGQHHRMFIHPEESALPAYGDFWEKLARGEFMSDQFRRIGKGGREVFIQATYNPVFGRTGKVYKVVKVAADITQARLQAMRDAGKISAISRAQAVIEFDTSGKILTANDNFLTALGYELSEIEGRRHSMFVDAAYAASAEYTAFWDRLRAGEFVSDEFCRLGKGGREVFIQASYNPIFDDKGQVTRVVKFATDVTPRVRAVRRIGSALDELAAGNLDQRLEEPFIPALDPIRLSLNASFDKLGEALREVAENASSMRSGADQIRHSADELAHRSEQQAAAIEETSAALSELTGSVRTSADQAGDAGKMVDQTRDDAERSARVVARAVEAMNLIKHSSDEIGKIIGVIDEIAFQTSLLALNAGVEAARAGEAGRGFAVVAQEVRGLAQRSAEAAKEIKSLISTSHEQVEAGVSMVGETGAALEGISRKVSGVHKHVRDIVEASRAQAVALGEINVAVGTFDRGTQQNAAMVEESTAASNTLAGEAAAMEQLVSRFRLGAPAPTAVHALNRKIANAVQRRSA
ncbi:methyl-accepting chemotaxis protein [Aureimonas populi]|uniref:Methyl-accepting chemotaxis protein n=1 Tax=Aureimonas populi TaxID=1701758 RepID=A0ABW5CLE9_9HYPH|nr:methyl-accepting chemotaxis protein [Aureimonas populi]